MIQTVETGGIHIDAKTKFNYIPRSKKTLEAFEIEKKRKSRILRQLKKIREQGKFRDHAV